MREWTDTHLHLLYPERLHYDWAAPLPALNRRFALEDYAPLARELGITRTLHMEVDVRESEIEAENRLVAELVAAPGSPLAGGISACRPEHDDFPAFLERQSANPLVRGFRRVLHVVPDSVSQGETFRRHLRLLGAAGYPFDLCLNADQLHLGLALARACPDLTLVLDHCGVPQVGTQALDPWRDDICALAALPRVHCKISGVIAYGNAARWPEGDIGAIAADLRPFVEHCIQSFGWQRVVWGSDFPVCNLTRGLAAWKAVTDRLLEGCSDSQIDALAHANAERLYRLAPVSSASAR
ncbi:MAG: amidohydrolase [Burkholderiales bacterium]|nr:amidohydrolase [Burkholderiales bacterium]MDE2453102.1 amidohydrolase [Burkholderiales bacterium]